MLTLSVVELTELYVTETDTGIAVTKKQSEKHHTLSPQNDVRGSNFTKLGLTVENAIILPTSHFWIRQ